MGDNPVSAYYNDDDYCRTSFLNFIYQINYMFPSLNPNDYCLIKGHVKSECYKFKRERGGEDKGNVASVGKEDK